MSVFGAGIRIMMFTITTIVLGRLLNQNDDQRIICMCVSVFEGTNVVVIRRSHCLRDVVCAVAYNKAERWCVWSVGRGEKWCVWCDDLSMRLRVIQTVLPYTG